MTRTQKQLYLTAGKFAPLTLATFVQVEIYLLFTIHFVDQLFYISFHISQNIGVRTNYIN